MPEPTDEPEPSGTPEPGGTPEAGETAPSDVAPSEETFDANAVLGQLRRLARLDTTVFDEVRDASKQTIPAAVVMVLGIVLAGVGGWLWLAIEFDGLDTGKILIKELLLGSAFAVALWVAWALITQVVLLNAFSVEADRMALLRCMGFAAAPAALMLLMLIPTLSFGIGATSLVAWFVLTNYAIQSAAPSATGNQVLISNMAGFFVFALVLSILADIEGLAPGVFAHAADLNAYFSFSISFS